MKRHGIFHGQRPVEWIVALIILMLLLLPTGCADEPSGGSSGTGSAALSITWHDAPVAKSVAAAQVERLDCTASGVDTVVVQVYDGADDGAGDLLITSDPFPCDVGNGTVTGIPAGTNRTIVLLAEDPDGNVIYQGKTTGITITAGHTTDGVHVDALPFVPVLIAPEDDAVLEPDEMTLQWETLDNAHQYQVVVARDEAFEQAVVDTVIDAEAADQMTYTLLDLEPSTLYYWRIHSLDRYLNQSAQSQVWHFTTSDCAFEILPENQLFEAQGGTGGFAVSASANDCQWSAVADGDWIQITTEASGSGDGTVRYTVAANSDASQRAGTITLGGKSHTVTQQGTSCTYNISSPEYSFGPEGGTNSFDVDASAADCEWSAMEDADWIEISAGADGSGDGTVSYTVAANTGAARSAFIIAAGQEHIVTQEPGACTYTLSLDGRTVAADGESYNVTITASYEACDWSASVPEASSDWISLAPTDGTGSGTVTITVAANSGVSREATLTIAGQPHTVSQAAGACTYSIDPVASSTISANGGSYDVAVTATHAECAWTTTVPNSANWITLSPANGTGNRSVTVTVAANNGASRQASLTIAGKTHTVSQRAGTCSFTISPATHAAPAGGESYEVSVTATHAECAWEASVPDGSSSWITLRPASGTGNGSVTITIAANSGASRQATLTIAGKSHTVSQAATCSFTISPATRAAPAEGESYEVSVTATDAQCAWTTEVNSNWITLSTGSGTGSGSVTVTVAANGGLARQAQITIAGQPHSVSQAAGISIP
jgi:hypothetical protein